MAFTSTLSAAIGLATKLSHLNEVFQNTKWLKDKVLGDGAESSGADGHIHPAGCSNALEVEVGLIDEGLSVTFTSAFSDWPAVASTPYSGIVEESAISAVSSTGFTTVDDPYGACGLLWVAVCATKN